jgi:leader peptidase (prepilin peptidase)/N-methyltransferase
MIRLWRFEFFSAAGSMIMDAWIIFFIFAFGACVGSFLNVVIWRMPRGQSIVFPGSHCPSCGRAIRWHDNIPILSWVRLKGRCRHCAVRISPRYLLVELATALLVVGLYVLYYPVAVRAGFGPFLETWPIFVVHAALLCGLLACSVIDIESYHVPLEVCWFLTVLALAVWTIWPRAELIPTVSPGVAAACLGGVIGLVVALLMMKRGWIQPSFIDAELRPTLSDDVTIQADADRGETKPAVGATADWGVNPRIEMLRELLFLAPLIGGAILAWVLVAHVGPAGRAWDSLYALAGGAVGAHLDGFFASLFGYFIAACLVWGMRIAGTLAFGREAMGLGDVHLLAAAGAACGWIVPMAAFFLAPLFGLLWALYLALRKGQRELPYGPWLSLGVLAAMLLYDSIIQWFRTYLSLLNG